MKNSIAALLTGLVVAFFSDYAGAFTLGADIQSGWAKPELTFLVNEASCTALGITSKKLNDAIDAAVNLWNSVPTSSLRIKKGATTTSTAMGDPPVIHCSAALTGSPDLDFVIAQGLFAYSAAKYPVMGVIEINGDSSKNAYFGGLDDTTAAITIAHEMGHVLGLGHSESSSALMYYDVSAKQKLNLSQDDIDGISWLNPRNEPGSGFMGCGTIESIGNGNGPGGPNIGVMLSWLMIISVAYLSTRRASKRRVASLL